MSKAQIDCFKYSYVWLIKVNMQGQHFIRLSSYLINKVATAKCARNFSCCTCKKDYTKLKTYRYSIFSYLSACDLLSGSNPLSAFGRIPMGYSGTQFIINKRTDTESRQ